MTGQRLRVIATLAAVVCLFAARQYFEPVFTDDDTFFFDVSYHLVQDGRMAADTYGSVIGADTFVAGMPVLYPLLTTVDVFAMRASHNAFFVKTTALLLLLGLGAIAARSIDFARFSIGAAAGMAVLFTDGWIANAFGSLRYDGWLIIVTTLSYLAMCRLITRGGWSNTMLLAMALALDALSHWQLLAIITAVWFNVAAFGCLRRKVRWTQWAALVAVIVAIYGAYASFISSDPGRREAFHLQMSEMRQYSGQPAGIDPVKKAKVLFGSVFYANEEHSAFSVVLLTLCALLGAALWRDLTAHGRRGIRDDVAIDVVFLACGLAPVFALDYIGARWIPMLVVVILMVARRTRDVVWARSILPPSILVINLAGYASLSHYLHLTLRDVLLSYAMVLLMLYVGCAAIARLTRRVATIAAVTVGLIAVNVVTNFELAAIMRGEPSAATERSVGESSRLLAQLVPGAFDAASSSAARQTEVFCDPTIHYLAIRRLDPMHHVIMRSLFPLLYLRADVAQNKYMAAFHPDYILLSDGDLEQLKSDRKVGPRFLAVVRQDYVPVGREVVAGVGTDVYRRR